MLKLLFHRQLLITALLLLMFACKHKEKQVVAKQRQTKAKPVENKSTNNSPPVNELQQKLGINNKQIKQNKLYSFIDDWYGTPYKYGGCQKVGVDCSCFANLLYDKVYDKKIARSAGDIFKECDKISIEEAKTGDLVFFKIGGNSISHVGVYLKSKMFVHASNSKGVVINSLDEAYYKKYFFCAGKMRNE